MEQIGNTDTLTKVLDLILELRSNARNTKDWNTADLIRNKLTDAGIRIEDSTDGSVYHIDS